MNRIMACGSPGPDTRRTMCSCPTLTLSAPQVQNELMGCCSTCSSCITELVFPEEDVFCELINLGF